MIKNFLDLLYIYFPHNIIASTLSPEPILESNIPRVSSPDKEICLPPKSLQVYSRKKQYPNSLKVEKSEPATSNEINSHISLLKSEASEQSIALWKGTRKCNHHPISNLYLSKIIFLI